MDAQTVSNYVNTGWAVIAFLVGQLVIAVWWASKMTTTLIDLKRIVEEMKEDGKESKAMIWEKYDELKSRVEAIEKTCLINHSHRREGDIKS